MNKKEFKRILAGLSLSTLLAGSGFVGVSYTHAGQGG
jgi:radical SAM modification target selenobiotic family peptide